MFFFRSDNKVCPEDDNIEILISRLQYSEYLDDKYEAIEDILKHCDKNIIETATLALVPIIYSIEELVEVSCNFKILYKFFTSLHKQEFIDLLLKNEKLVKILFNNKHKEEKGFLNLLNELTTSLDFCKHFVTINGVSHYCVNLIDDNNLIILERCINLNNHFDKEIVFEGVFEKILEKYEELEMPSCFLKRLIYKNHFNQNYFIETDWYKISEVVINDLVDNTNNNIEYIKDRVFKIHPFSKAIEEKNYDFIYVMILKSEKYRNILLDLFYDDNINCNVDDTCNINNNINNINEYTSNTNFINNNNINEYINNNNIINEHINDTNNNINNNIDTINNNIDTINEYINNNTNINNNLDNNTNINIENRVIKDEDLLNILYYFIHKQIINYDSSTSVLLIYSEILRDTIKCKRFMYKNITNDFISNNQSSVANILLLLSIRNYEYNFDISLLDINLGTIIYFIVLADTNYITSKVSVIKYIISSESSEPMLVKLCILLCCIHKIKLNYNIEYLKENAKYIRKVLVNQEIDKLNTIDEITNLIIDKINELITFYSQ